MDVMNNNIEFVEFDRRFLDCSFRWLSNTEIKRLTDSPDINECEQEKWYVSLSKRKDYYIKGIQYNGLPIGAVGIKNIDSDSGEYWGYIGEKDYWGQGIGKLMILQMIKDARDVFSLKSLHLKVLHDNDRAISLYAKMGFNAESDDGKFFIMTLFL